MTDIETADVDIPDSAAASVLRYEEVLASEWKNMRGWLARREWAPVGHGFAASRRIRAVSMPQPETVAHQMLAVPRVCSAEAIAENLDLARDVLRRVRIADAVLGDATATQCMSWITSRYVADPRPDGPVLLAPEDDEPGRMMVRALTWLRDLPKGWAISDERFDEFTVMVDDAFARLAADPDVCRVAQSVLNSIILVDHPTQRAGVCSASLSHMWVSPAVVRSVDTLVDVIRGGVVHNSLYFDELVHSKWAVDPQPLDDTKVVCPVPGFESPMEYDTAFHAAHIEYMRLRAAQSGVRTAQEDAAGFQTVHKVIAEMLQYPGHLTDHGKWLLNDLDRLSKAASSDSRQP